MDCETCHDLLLDLAYGELDEVRAAAARKHTEGCNDCRQALKRITRGRSLARQLPLEPAPPPSPALLAAIEAAAARASSPPAESAEQATPPLGESDTGAHGGPDFAGAPPHGRAMSRWLERLGEIVMRRQVAMAAVMVLTLGVSLVFYQTHPRPTDLPDDRAPDVVPAEEIPGNSTARAGESHAPVPHATGSVSPSRPGAERDEAARLRIANPSPRAASEGVDRATREQAAVRPIAPPSANTGEEGSLDNTPPQPAAPAAEAAPAYGNAGRVAGVARSPSDPSPPLQGFAQQQQPTSAQFQWSAATVRADADVQTSAGSDRAALEAAIRQLQDAVANATDAAARNQYRQRLAALLRRAGNTAGAETVEAEVRASVEANTARAAAPTAPAAAAPPVAQPANVVVDGEAQTASNSTNANGVSTNLELRARHAHTPRPARRAAPAANYAAPAVEKIDELLAR